jgi:hypothetical protein
MKHPFKLYVCNLTLFRIIIRPLYNYLISVEVPWKAATPNLRNSSLNRKDEKKSKSNID